MPVEGKFTRGSQLLSGLHERLQDNQLFQDKTFRNFLPNLNLSFSPTGWLGDASPPTPHPRVEDEEKIFQCFKIFWTISIIFKNQFISDNVDI